MAFIDKGMFGFLKWISNIQNFNLNNDFLKGIFGQSFGLGVGKVWFIVIIAVLMFFYFSFKFWFDTSWEERSL